MHQSIVNQCTVFLNRCIFRRQADLTTGDTLTIDHKNHIMVSTNKTQKATFATQYIKSLIFK